MVILKISKEQAAVLSQAAELYSRVKMGQLDHIASLWQSLETRDLHVLQEGLRALEPIVTGMPPGAFYGIRSPVIADTARIAWDLTQVIRHHLAWRQCPTGGTEVDFGEPRRTSTEEELAQCDED